MPIKKDKKKLKDSIRPSLRLKRKTTKKTKEIAPLVKYIFTERVPKKKCCTDVTKTGQAYTIPFGFADRLGTTRLETPTPTSAPLKATLPSVKPISEKKEYLTIETQTDKPSKASKKIQVNIKEPVKKKLIILEEGEDEPMPSEEIQTEVTQSEKRKYDKSKADENKMRLLSQLYNLLTINNSIEDSRVITESYKTQSNTKIKERINSEKQAVKKI